LFSCNVKGGKNSLYAGKHIEVGDERQKIIHSIENNFNVNVPKEIGLRTSAHR
jgi:hypothetical protein